MVPTIGWGIDPQKTLNLIPICASGLQISRPRVSGLRSRVYGRAEDLGSNFWIKFLGSGAFFAQTTASGCVSDPVIEQVVYGDNIADSWGV